MANPRDTSKQKRARANRAQREALKARTSAASSAPEERRTRATATPAPTKGGKGSAAKGAKGDRAERAPRERPLRPGDVPVDVTTLEGNWFSKRMAVPGGRQIITGLLMTIGLVIITVVSKFPVIEDIDKDAKGQELALAVANNLVPRTVFEIYGPIAALLVALPLLAMVVAAVYTTSVHRRRIWIGAAIANAVVVLFGFTTFLFAGGFVIYALWRAGKVEGPAPGSRAARSAERRAAAARAEAGEVVDEP